MQIDNWTRSRGGSSEHRERQERCEKRTDMEHDVWGFAISQERSRGEGVPRDLLNAEIMDERLDESHETMRCHSCGYETSTEEKPDPLNRRHLQVVVACGSCGRHFTVISAN